MKDVTTRSGLAYAGPLIPTNSPLEIVVEQNTEEITDKEHSNYQGRASINLMPLSIWKKLSLLELTPTWMTLELADRSIIHPKGVAEDVFVMVGRFHFPIDFVVVDFEADPRVPLFLGRSFLRTGRALINVYGEEITLRLLNEDPFQLPPMDLKLAEKTKEKSSVEVPLELELKELLSHLEYAFLEDSNKLPVIIAKDIKDVEKEALIKVLKSHKRAIAWKIFDIKGHKISESSIKVDRAKVDIIAKLPHLTTVKGIRSFLGHAGFYRRFIQDFSKIARPMTHLLEKETPLVFSIECVDAFDTLKKKLTEAPILVVPEWNLPFELMCDASDFAIGTVLGQWVLLLQEFDITILDKKGSENLTADHLSRLENPHKDVLENKDINENFPLETLGSLSCDSTPCCVHGQEAFDILEACHEGPTGGHHGANLTVKKAYENSVIYKERTKKLHDSKIKNRIFNVGDQVLLFNSRLKIFSGELKTRWSGPFTITQVFPYGTLELSQSNGPNFKVNGHRVKHYFGGDIPSNIVSDLHTYIVPTGRVIVPTGRYVVPTGRVIVATGRYVVRAEEHIAVQRESKARTTLLRSIPDDHVADFHYMDDARDIWNAVKARFGGNAKSKKMRQSMLKQEFSEFRISEAEGLYKGYDRMQKILSQLNQLKAKPDAEEINLRFLRALPSSWSQKAGRKIDFDKKESARFNKQKVRCYKCQQRGHFSRKCRSKGGNDKQRYSSFKIKEIGKKEEDSKALVTIDTLVDWTNHDSESAGVIAAKEFSMIASCDSGDVIKRGTAKLYNLITGANS
uniref:Reverse transcriptase domain-containing protein n=1 Tax=Tanacetum cinerariifolium TaxID=118510 RepID=A0A6L2J7M8_TANCI|nr:reverse transcriptase domain-containing protein [Tanacetum cinerariifolium]